MAGFKLAQRIEHWPLGKLTKFDRNPRTHDGTQVAKIAASISEFGFTNPILVDGDGVIIAGHGRLAAAQALKMPEVPVVVLDHLNESQRIALVIADNRLALDAGWDDALLGELLAELEADGYDLELTGFNEDEIDELLDNDEIGGGADSNDEDSIPETEIDPVSQHGDVWRLGLHRVMCGNSTDMADVEVLTKGELVDCVWMDPPYNVNYEGTAGKIANDNMSAKAFGEFLQGVYRCAFAAMRPGAPIYVAHADTEGEAFRREFREAGFHLSRCLVWRKNALVLGRSDYHWQHEPILYGWKPGAAHSWYGARDKTTIHEFDAIPVQNIGPGQWQIGNGETAVVVAGKDLTMQLVNTSVFLEEKPKSNSMHPTMKPVGLIERQLENSTARGDAVMDLFGGSGSTLIACEKLNRSAVLMELEPKFVDVIVRRWQEFTGKTAVHDAAGKSFSEMENMRKNQGGGQ